MSLSGKPQARSGKCRAASGERAAGPSAHKARSCDGQDGFPPSGDCPGRRVLVIEDVADIRELLRWGLSPRGFEVLGARSGPEGLDRTLEFLPHLVVLDLLLPGLGGLEVCRRIKADPRTGSIPVLVLTANDSESVRIAAFEQGADDYLPKPFSLRELCLRIRNILARLEMTARQARRQCRLGDLVIDFDGYLLRSACSEVRLTRSECLLLAEVLHRQGTALSRPELKQALHPVPEKISNRAIDTLVRRLRGKLGPCGNYLKTVRGRGYLLALP